MTLGATYKNNIGIDYEKPTYKYRFSNRSEALKDTINDIIEIINQDRLDPYVRQKAIEIIREAGVKDRDTYGIIKAIYEYLQDNVSYVEDPKDVEFMQRTRRLLEKTRAGDCDDFTIAGASLLLSLNIDVKLKVVGTESSSYFNHIYIIVKDKSEWIPFDPIYKDRKLGQEPVVIKIFKIFPIKPISVMYNNSSLAVILNGDKKNMKDNTKKKLYNDLGFYNNALNTLSTHCKQMLSGYSLGNDTGNEEYQEAMNFFDYNTKPRIVDIKQVPEDVKKSVSVDENIQKDYENRQLTFNAISKNPNLVGYLTAEMLDGYTGLGFFKNLWSGVKNFFKNPVKNIASGVKKLASNKFVQKAVSFIPGAGPLISSGMEMASKFIPDFSKSQQPQMPQQSQPQMPQRQGQGMFNRVMQNPYVQRTIQQVPFMNNAYNFMKRGFNQFQNFNNMFQNFRSNFSGDMQNSLVYLPLINGDLNPFLEDKIIRSIADNLADNLKGDKLGVFNKMVSKAKDLFEKEKTRRQEGEIENPALSYVPEKTEKTETRRQEGDNLTNLIRELFDILEISPEGEGNNLTLQQNKIINELKDRLLENYIKIFLAWDLLEKEEREQILNTLKTEWGITSPIVSNPPKWASDKVLKLYKKEIVDLNRRAKKEKLKYEEIKEKLKSFVKRLEKLQDEYNRVKKLQQEKYTKLTEGLGQDTDTTVEDELDNIEEQISEQEEQINTLIEVQESALVKLLVTQLINLYKRIIELISEKRVNKAVIEKLTEDTQRLESRLEEQINKKDNLNEEIKEYIKKLEQAKKDFNDKLKQKTEEFNEQKKEIVNIYESDIKEKKKKINELAISYRVAKAMYKLLPDSSRQFIDEFEKEGIDLAKADLDTIEKLYEKYAHLRLEIKDKFNEIKDKAIEKLKNLYLDIENYLSMIRADLDIINKQLREIASSDINDAYEILEKRYSDLRADFRKAKKDETFYIQSLYAGVKQLSENTKKLLVMSIKSEPQRIPNNKSAESKESNLKEYDNDFVLM